MGLDLVTTYRKIKISLCRVWKSATNYGLLLSFFKRDPKGKYQQRFVILYSWELSRV